MDVENDPDKRIDFNNMFDSGVKVIIPNSGSHKKKLVTMAMELHPVQSFQLRD